MSAEHSSSEKNLNEQTIKDVIEDRVEERLNSIFDDRLASTLSPSDDQLIKAEDQRRSLFEIAFIGIFIIIGLLYASLLVWIFSSKTQDWHIFAIGVTALVIPASTLSIILIKSLSKAKENNKESDVAISLGLKAILDTIKDIVSIFKK